MKKTLTLLLFSLLVSPILADTPLNDAMSEMNSHLKSIRKAETFEAKAEAVRGAQSELLKCFELIPALTEKTEDPEAKAKEVAHYKKLIAQNYALLCEYELAFLEEDEEKAKELYTQLRAAKKEGHDAYIEE